MSEPLPGVSAQAFDPFVRQLREQISRNDRRILAAVNTRLELVARMRRYKRSRGIAFDDPDREEWLLSYLQQVNTGPLSQEGLEEIVLALLELTKREVTREEGAS